MLELEKAREDLDEDVEVVPADEIRRRPFRLALAPNLTLFCAVREAVAPGSAGVDEPCRRAIRAQLRQRDLDALAPLTRERRTIVPDTILALPQARAQGVRDALELVATAPEERLLAEIAGTGEASAETWRAVERHPRRWLVAYATAMTRAWKGFAPVWRHTKPLFAREVERVAAASARDAQVELMDRLHPGARVRDGAWRMPSLVRGGPARFPADGLVLAPLVADMQSCIVAARDDCITHLAYPMPRSEALLREQLDDPAALEALVGQQRARILRQLERPRTVGELADALVVVPSAVTHHVTALTAAGLVRRERRGRHVLVGRTPRADALLSLYVSRRG